VNGISFKTLAVCHMSLLTFLRHVGTPGNITRNRETWSSHSGSYNDMTSCSVVYIHWCLTL